MPLPPSRTTTVCQSFGKAGVRNSLAYERYRERFFVNDAFLAALERQRPKSPQYLVRSQRGGTMAKRWNIIPASVTEGTR